MEKVRAAQQALGRDHELSLRLLTEYAERDADSGTERYHEVRRPEAWPQARALALRLVRSFTERDEPWHVARAFAVIARIHAVEGKQSLAVEAWAESVRHHLNAHHALQKRWTETRDETAASIVTIFRAWQRETGADSPRRIKLSETPASRAIYAELHEQLKDCDRVALETVLQTKPLCGGDELKKEMVLESAAMLRNTVEHFLDTAEMTRTGMKSIVPLDDGLRETLLGLWAELPQTCGGDESRVATAMTRVAKILSREPQSPARALNYMRQARLWQRVATKPAGTELG